MADERERKVERTREVLAERNEDTQPEAEHEQEDREARDKAGAEGKEAADESDG